MTITKREILDQLMTAARQFGVPTSLVILQCQAESNWKQDARSPVGAIGLMQLMPGTARELEVDPLNWQQNIHGGVKYMSRMHNQFGSWDKALAAYNWGPGNMAKHLKKHGENWQQHLPAETKKYLQRIMG